MHSFGAVPDVASCPLGRGGRIQHKPSSSLDNALPAIQTGHTGQRNISAATLGRRHLVTFVRWRSEPYA